MNFLPVRLDDRVAVVTGANGGLGRRCALALANAGAAVGLLDRSGDRLEAIKEEIVSAGGRAICCIADVTDERSLNAAFDSVRSAFGPITILNTAAGVLAQGDFIDVPIEEWDRVYAVNVRGSVLAVKLVTNDMISAGGGRVILVSSALALMTVAKRSAYIASKTALVGATHALALELGKHGITVNALAPVAVLTDINRHLFESQAELYRPLIEGTPMGRMCTEDDVANVLLFLASNYASFLTGHVYPIDGGFTVC